MKTLATFNELADRLNELGVPNEPETEQMIQAVLSGRFTLVVRQSEKEWAMWLVEKPFDKCGSDEA